MRSSTVRSCVVVGVVVLLSGYTGAALEQSSAAVRVLNASPYEIAADDELRSFVNNTAETAIAENCASCHGADLSGGPGVPNLVDYDWLWGITGQETNDVYPVIAIQQTLLYGVRNRDCPEDRMSYGACSDTRYSEMLGYGVAGFSEEQISDFTEWVIAMSGWDTDDAAVERAGATSAICAECHGGDSYGYVPYGGPNLRDDIWLYGSDRDTIHDVIANGRLGVCPPWGEALDVATIKSLAVYIWNMSMGL
ncbi:MAG: c-type cytochrome [Candidatus Rariloculaceae bacterium]